MHFHIPTMLLMLVVAFGVMAMGLAFFAPAQHRALRLTALGLLVHGAGYALLGLRGDIPLLLSILGGNLGITLAAALYLLALYRFQERAPHWWLLALPVLNLLLSVATYFTAGRQAKNNGDSAAMARIVCERYLRNGCITGVFLNVINVYFMYSAITGTGFGFGF